MPFKKGQSGNPAGTPDFWETFAMVYKRILATDDPLSYEPRNGKEQAAMVRIRKAIEKGDMRALEGLEDRVDGKPTQRNENDNNNTQKVIIMTEEERKIAEGE